MFKHLINKLHLVGKFYAKITKIKSVFFLQNFRISLLEQVHFPASTY